MTRRMIALVVSFGLLAGAVGCGEDSKAPPPVQGTTKEVTNKKTGRKLDVPDGVDAAK